MPAHANRTRLPRCVESLLRRYRAHQGRALEARTPRELCALSRAQWFVIPVTGNRRAWRSTGRHAAQLAVGEVIA